ncbi:MAG: hypothetical protein Q7T55_16270 [Solirubrobacteraceae bacterium]|nr:hypothetical protein [Solirubrobacteraceae bacterium]
MAELLRSTTWRLRPEQLIAACALLDIESLPHSRFVDGEDAAGHVYTVGMRSLLIARLATVGEDDEDPALEAHLASVLLALLGDGPQAVGQLTGPGAALHAFTVRDGVVYSLVETDTTVDLMREPLAEGLARLRRTTAVGLDGVGEVSPSCDRAAVVGRSRWARLQSGGPARTSDDPLTLRAAATARADAMWEATCLVALEDGGYRGVSIGWTVDHEGVVIVEPGPLDTDDGPLLRVRCGAETGVEIRGVWDGLRSPDRAAGGSV